MAWFADKGQILQIALQFLALIPAAKNAFLDMNANNFLSAGAIVFYLLVGSVVVSLWFAGRRLMLARERGRLRIYDASYDKLPRHDVNLTTRVRELVRNNELSIRVDPDVFHIKDPYPGEPKSLRVIYSYADKESRTIECNDYEVLSLPLDRDRE